MGIAIEMVADEKWWAAVESRSTHAPQTKPVTKINNQSHFQTNCAQYISQILDSYPILNGIFSNGFQTKFQIKFETNFQIEFQMSSIEFWPISWPPFDEIGQRRQGRERPPKKNRTSGRPPADVAAAHDDVTHACNTDFLNERRQRRRPFHHLVLANIFTF